jgi:hypothetical protein
MGGQPVVELAPFASSSARDEGRAASEGPLPLDGGSCQERGLEIEIRSALVSRVVQTSVFAVGGFVAAVGTIALAGRGSPWAALAAAAAAVWSLYFWRLIGLSVTSRGEVLEVRNLYATRRVPRSAVRSVTLGPSNVAKAPSRTVVIELADGSLLPLDACARTVQPPRRARRVAELQRRLAEWAAAVDGAGSGA